MHIGLLLMWGIVHNVTMCPDFTRFHTGGSTFTIDLESYAPVVIGQRSEPCNDLMCTVHNICPTHG